ncbi:MAG: hypothetical protein LBN22_10775 [Clostridiales Family XIII bacterium]|jgi:hypothetical protein|nr:hypothetical protein [Clostridiales Family XIII bacterium]
MPKRVFTKRKISEKLKVFIFVLLAVAILVAIFPIAERVTRKSEAHRLKIATDAVVRSTVQCYALESRYPPTLEYLQDNYGLTLNEDKFIYHYAPIGVNMMPQIKVFEKTKQK